MHGLFKPRQDTLRTRGMSEHFVHTKLLNKEWRESIFPVVEVAGNQHRGTFGHHALNALGHHFNLASSPPRKQTQMHDEAMDFAPTYIDHTVQQSTLFKLMVRDVLILKIQNRVT